MRRVALLFLLVLAGCGGGEVTSDIPSGGDAPPAEAPAPAAEEAPKGCTAVDQPEPAEEGGRKAPRDELDASKRWTATVTTNCGRFAFRLDVKSSPKTAASFAALARAGFYEQTVFHRIVPGFVIQGGDPTGTGSGGPGYKTVEAPPRGTKYTSGVVAMAKGGDEEAGTAGSQFFVVTGDASQLTPDYAVLGRIASGQRIVDRIGELGDQAEQPTFTVVIEKIEIDSR